MKRPILVISTALMALLFLLAMATMAQEQPPFPTDAIATIDAQSTRIADLEATIAALDADADNTGVEVIDTEDLEGDFRRIITSEFSLDIPDSYEGGNLEEDRQAVLQSLELLGPDFANIVAQIRANPDLFRLFAFDNELTTGGFLSNINVIAETPLTEIDFETYREISLRNVPDTIEIVEEGFVTVGDQQTLRLITEWEIQGIPISQLQYIYKVGDSFFAVTISTGREEFAERLDIFESVGQSFTPLD